MPVKVEKQNDKYCVVEPDGSVVKCHDTEKQAEAHSRAINANVGDKGEKGYAKMSPLAWSALSFAELEQAEEAMERGAEVAELTANFQLLIDNVMHSGSIESTEKSAYVRKLAGEFADRLEVITRVDIEKGVLSAAEKNDLPDSSFLYIESGGEKDDEGKTVPRSLRHLPFKDKGGKILLPQLRNAIARANQVKMVDGSKISTDKADILKKKAQKILEQAKGEKEYGNVVSRVVGAAKKVVGAEDEVPAIQIWKDQGDVYRWVARYSNMFRDDDIPVKEILSSDAHRNFVKLVDEGIVDPPNLVFWHEANSLEIGQSEWVAYDESGFPLAGGYIHPEFNEFVDEIKSLPDVRLSHGMPGWSIRRDDNDPSIITEYVTDEISLLPGWAAANKRTGFYFLGDS